MTQTSSLLDGEHPPIATFARMYAGAMLAVAIATVAGMAITQRWGDDPVVLLYILPVLGAAIYGGLWPALSAGVASTLAYNYYFTQPYRTLFIHSPADVVTVIVLFLVAVITSRLASQLRAQAKLAAAHASRNATIAGFARKLLTCTSDDDIAATATHEIADLFRCNTVLLTGDNASQLLASSPPGASLAPSDLAAAALTLTTGVPSGRGIQKINLVDWQFQPIASKDHVLAVLGLAREDGTVVVTESQTALLTNMLDQTALAIERARLEGDNRDLSILRERDTIRSRLLASIGEDVKPRLNAIGAAVRELKRGGLADKGVLALMSSEVSKLDRYVDNLVEIGPDEQPLPIRIDDITIDLHRREVFKGDDAIHLTPKEFALLAEMAKQHGRVLTHRHLLMAVWGPAHAEQVDYLRVAIRSLRQKLENDASVPALILNEPAVGYRLANAPN